MFGLLALIGLFLLDLYMNRYPLWKYLLILVVVVAGAIYALPNIYAPDPAIQISGSSAGTKVTAAEVSIVSDALDANGIKYFGVEQRDGNGLIRLYSVEDQLAAQRKAQEALGEDEYVVAVNLATTVPDWLQGIGADSMKLGLDLAGGVHFLLEVDTPQVLAKEMKSIETSVRKAIRTENIRGVSVRASEDQIVVTADSDEKRSQVTSILRKDTPELEYVRLERDGKFVVEAKMSESFIKEKEAFAINQNLTTLRKRVNELGVSEPVVQRQGRNRIVVQLPGIQDTARAKSIIGKAASLEFRIEAEPSALASRKEYFPYKDEEKQRIFGGVYLQKKGFVRGENVTNAQVSFDPDSSLPQVNIGLDSKGGDLMSRTTRKHVKERMAVLFIEYKTRTERYIDENGNEQKRFTQIPQTSVISMATIQETLARQFRVTGLDSYEEAAEFALLLRAGALAAPMGFVEERTIGPSLGAENVATGVKSVQLGLALVLIFMLVYYKVFGFAANIALAVNLGLLVAVMSLLGATLTLPGIAGIVLTVGMAVDANVLIFSRIKEELKNGLPPQSAIKSGFDRAFVTILDANITTLFVAVILYAIGSGPVKGFAVTLAIGILTSMFTAIMGTRAVVNLIYGNRQVKALSI